MANFLKSLFGDENLKKIKAIQPLVDKINALSDTFKALSDNELKAKTEEFRQRLSKGETTDDLLPEAFAAVREASTRTLKQRHFDVQLIGGIVIHKSGIAEMRTGEGKTLVATLPAYLNALEGKGVHVVTVNDYLSRRDAVWMGQIYSFLGLSVGVINHESSFIYDSDHRQIENANIKIQNEGKEDELDKMRDDIGSFKVVHEFLRPVSRQEAYRADITYGTNNEYGFDYLRDNLEYNKQALRQRDYHYAIVDEIDSILIDEARTPLIISAPTMESEDLYGIFARIADKMVREEDFTVDEKFKSISMTDKGIEKAEKVLGVDNIYTEKGMKYVHHLETAVRAKALFQKDKEYVVKNDEVVIVDEFTGRLQPGRRWSEGLHQAIEAKEGVRVQKESRTFASITFQNYFRMYKKLSGMTGTAKTSAEEFYKVYGLDVVSIPTNKPSAREDLKDQIFQTERGKFKAISRKVKELNRMGQPVLIGTVSIEKNELLSGYLQQEGVEHTVLNAKNHEREGEIIAQAGRVGSVTIATNMAGRGVDIKLGGIPAPEGDYDKVKSLGGLFVLGTERHEARRIDNQLRGRSGRQGDPGTTQFYVSMEDSLMRVFASDIIKKMMGTFGIPEDEPIEHGVIGKSLETAQTKIEGFNFDSRKHILEYDDVLNHQRKIVYERRRKILLGTDTEVAEKLNEMLEGNDEAKKMVEDKIKAIGEKEFYSVARRVLLQSIDTFWVDHLELMDYSRSSVNLRAYGQRDPLVEYKREGLRLFKEMEQAVRDQVASILPGIGVVASQKNDGMRRLQEVHEQAQLIGGGDPSTGVRGNGLGTGQANKSLSGVSRVGRNDPCPCGAVNPTTGKAYKYKQCGLINASYHRKG
ncbi:MAG: preprotein translocase subunit SecA [Candidatus Taylorbacteria bacterium RIFCSPLOWO2_02_FULL_43_11]|uniref:Protein translocase subunit SecA n=1 Tax=Candidatus Taylorbacteria bacterium RIFCSPHIGHO2_02_FULL_43_32b TaxID=1802306 RepID=A0A1G2MLL4_9BACT|nr:MAG: preprotein translocase subunit SecA [Candidatus Taylorbacteria bacterium RIFCSPHIGHO2_01_FULL_43_47]OHA24747.1 MAG: preprotein translocase subunit SecA [Candidatus Taylorbacteria bacterium RIFCSPHIGHO2_02_FULL_43_32b]OHA31672.1 MAG: preprotein translocase subunit SecA [Candidatus Taylorbacteria bacterium RIFCSPLOWO2_01_FULL_43_44]OHA35386.1 MAG: preprotein translocase subunit SecA [Candidatus Taylorbacteria bacterium RIFCSPLOWO2_02_FULL_43_11]